MRDADLKKLKPLAEINLGRGLRVRKNKDTSCTWILMGRIKGSVASSSPKRLSLGRWPEMTLDDAEEKARGYRSLLQKGIDPTEHDKKLKKEAAARAEEEAAKGITLWQLFEKYKRDAEDRRRPPTPRYLKQVQSSVENVWGRFKDTPIQEIKGRDLRDEYSYWNSQRISPRTGRPARTMSDLAVRHGRILFNFAINQLELLERSPFGVFRLEAIKRNEDYLAPPEAVKVFYHLDIIGEWSEIIKQEGFAKIQPELNDEYKVLKEYAFSEKANSVYNNLRLSLLTGLRGKHEVTSLAWENVFLEESEWKARHAKGPYFQIWQKQQRWFGVPITEQMELIFRKQKLVRTNDYVFPAQRRDGFMENGDYAYNVINQLMDFAYADKISPNVVRHTFASACQTRYPFNLDIARRLTGHGATESKDETINYTHFQAHDLREHFTEINNLICGEVTDPPLNWGPEYIFSEEELAEMDKEPDFPKMQSFYDNASKS